MEDRCHQNQAAGRPQVISWVLMEDLQQGLTRGGSLLRFGSWTFTGDQLGWLMKGLSTGFIMLRITVLKIGPLDVHQVTSWVG